MDYYLRLGSIPYLMIISSQSTLTYIYNSSFSFNKVLMTNDCFRITIRLYFSSEMFITLLATIFVQSSSTILSDLVMHFYNGTSDRPF